MATHMFFPLVHLTRDERLGSFPQYPFLSDSTAPEIEPDFGTGRQKVCELRELMIKERRPAFDGMGHFHAITH